MKLVLELFAVQRQRQVDARPQPVIADALIGFQDGRVDVGLAALPSTLPAIQRNIRRVEAVQSHVLVRIEEGRLHGPALHRAAGGLAPGSQQKRYSFLREIDLLVAAGDVEGHSWIELRVVFKERKRQPGDPACLDGWLNAEPRSRLCRGGSCESRCRDPEQGR